MNSYPAIFTSESTNTRRRRKKPNWLKKLRASLDNFTYQPKSKKGGTQKRKVPDHFKVFKNLLKALLNAIKNQKRKKPFATVDLNTAIYRQMKKGINQIASRNPNQYEAWNELNRVIERNMLVLIPHLEIYPVKSSNLFESCMGLFSLESFKSLYQDYISFLFQNPNSQVMSQIFSFECRNGNADLSWQEFKNELIRDVLETFSNREEAGDSLGLGIN